MPKKQTKPPEETSLWRWDWPFKNTDGSPRTEVGRVRLSWATARINYSNGTFSVVSPDIDYAAEQRLRKEAQQREIERMAVEAQSEIAQLWERSNKPTDTLILDVCGLRFDTARTIQDLIDQPYPREWHRMTVVLQSLELRYGSD